ncbi:Thioredoxin reductase 1, cytoplasmic [Lamellibrachia satsuma]|nr:Thioredoxin reductase 1, cytoplasmic [Lamellibrachia satsuma]
MVRSILLRGFDQQIAEMIGDHMTKHNIKFIRPCVPTKVEKVGDGEPGTLRVTATMQNDGSEVVGEYNTVLFAVGREPCTKTLGLDKVGVKLNTRWVTLVVMFISSHPHRQGFLLHQYS